MRETETIWLVLDTNVYLHFAWFEDIPWKDILQREFGYVDKEIGVVVPVKVLQELSDKKDSERGKIQKRAKKVSSFLCDVFLSGKKGKVSMCTIPLPKDKDFDDINFHLSNSDDIIVLSVINSDISSNSIIVSGDGPMLLKAKESNLRFYKLDDKYRLNEELTENEKKIKELEKELASYRNRLSDIKVLFKDNNDHIEIKRTHFDKDKNELLDAYRKDLESAHPCKCKPDQDIAYTNPLAILHNSEYLFPADSFDEYNRDREKYIKDSLYKKELEIIADRQKQTFKELSFYIDNNGTASSGNINIELYFPQEIILYRKPASVHYEKPIEPKLGINVNLLSKTHISLYGYPEQDSIKIWNKDCITDKHTFSMEYKNLNHHMTGFLEKGIWIDTSRCRSFSVDWVAIDSNNPKMFQGKLNVIIKD